MASVIIIIFKIGESMKTEAEWGFPEVQRLEEMEYSSFSGYGFSFRVMEMS